MPLEGASNLRDLGGWPVADGRRVRRGLIFRSATLANLTEADQALVAGLGIRTVCDLRGVNEAALRPSRLPPSAERVHLPIEPSVGASLRDLMLREESTGEDVVSLLRRAYHRLSARASSMSIAGCSGCCWSSGGRRCCSIARPARTAPGWGRRWC